ncbi:MAG TPA: type II toxin-antitoxin system antitoxin SocA domain-containing protein [Patescibacteria group bacterium]|nr:type II toxin-antitoxin system antitoxin SocA domain-containing protein [Patescibacteria group bacterium]
MKSYINNLAKEILNIEQNGLSKVRFAKILYFVHKGLILENLVKSEDMKFIRMPLGPVPVGFKKLSEDSDIAVETKLSSLTYNTEIYKLINYTESFERLYKETIKRILNDLRMFPTSELIKISHHEPSWNKLTNGSEYFISGDDLRENLPKRTSSHKLSSEIDEQRIQARLVEGMINDIVEESTLLEYPVN